MAKTKKIDNSPTGFALGLITQAKKQSSDSGINKIKQAIDLLEDEVDKFPWVKRVIETLQNGIADEPSDEDEEDNEDENEES